MSKLMDKFTNAIFGDKKFNNKMLPSMGTVDQLKQLKPYMTQYLAWKAGGASMGIGGKGSRNMTPGAMLGHIPLFAVTSVEVGKSDKQLRFRSIGGQFLAYQEGDNLSLRIDLLLSGESRFFYLSLLDGLYMKGLATVDTNNFRNVTYEAGKNPSGASAMTQMKDPNNPNLTISVLQGTIVQKLNSSGSYEAILKQSTTMTPVKGNTQLVDYQQQAVKDADISVDGTTWDKSSGKMENLPGYKQTSDDPWQEIPYWQERERIVMHKTFPVILEEEIFTRMYIESMFWRKSVGANGRDDISVNILMRRFIDPPEKMYIDTYERTDVKGTNWVNKSKLTKDTKAPGGKTAFESPDTKAASAAKSEWNDPNKLPGAGLLKRTGPDAGKPPVSIENLGRDAKSGQLAKNNFANGVNPRANQKFSYDPNREQTDREEYYKNKVAASDADIKNKKNIYKSSEDKYDKSYTRHRYVTTVPNNAPPGDIALLAVNYLWRGMMLGSNVAINAISGKSLRIDPIIGRLISWGKNIANGGATANTKTNNLVRVSGASQEIQRGDTGADEITRAYYPSTSQHERRMALNDFLVLMGIDVPGKDFDEILTIPARQTTFENVVLAGCSYTKFSGDIPIKGSLSFTTPFQMTWGCDFQTSPYMETKNVHVNLKGYVMKVQEGMLYFLGTQDKPTLMMNPTTKEFYWNKLADNEMYLYVKQLKMMNDKIQLVGYIIKPARGM